MNLLNECTKNEINFIEKAGDVNMKIDYDYIKDLKEVIDSNKDKRICVVGTSCTGKTTYLEYAKTGLDMDEIIFPLLSSEEKEYVCQTPWTPEIGETMDRLVKERIQIKPGQPVFGTVIIDCDLIIYLGISDELLQERTKSRNVDYQDAKNMKDSIEKDIEDTTIPVIRIQVKDKELEI